jgi:hypothetical protein
MSVSAPEARPFHDSRVAADVPQLKPSAISEAAGVPLELACHEIRFRCSPSAMVVMSATLEVRVLYP